MKKLISLLVFSSVFSCLHASAQTTASQVVNGSYAEAPQANCATGPCFVPYSSGYPFENITSADTTVVKDSPGTLRSVCLNTLAASGVVTLYNNTEASGAVIATITNPETLLSEGPICVSYNSSFDVGLTVVTTGVQDITITYN